MAVVRKTTTKLEDLPNCPTALGIATDDMLKVVFPEIAFDQVPGGVTFRLTTADYVQTFPQVLLVAAGTHVAGLGQFTPGAAGPVKPQLYEYNAAVGATRAINVYVPATAKHTWVGAAPTPPKRISFQALLHLDQATFATLKDKEDEHLADFEEAYKLTAKAVADRVNGLAGRVFASEDAAMHELLLHTPPLDARLVPKYPLELSTWKPRLLQIANALANLSLERDTGGTKEHCPDGYDATLDWNAKPTPTLTFSPRMRAMSTPTSALIRLDKLPAAEWDGVALRPPTGATLTPGQTARVTAETRLVLVYRQKGKSGWDFDEDGVTIRAGVSCTVEEIAADGVWISLTQAQCNAIPAMKSEFKDYFGSFGKATKVWCRMPAHALA